MPIGFDSGGLAAGGPADRSPGPDPNTSANLDGWSAGPNELANLGGWVETPRVVLIPYPVVIEVWQPVADGRTCPECSPYDGTLWEAGSGPVPPLHPNCRCRRITHHIEWRVRQTTKWELTWQPS
jgi:hypothetical protein